MESRFLLLALPLMLTFGPTATALAKPVPSDHGCMGRWVGRGQNSGYTTFWTIDLTLSASPSGGRCGTVEYTNPVCGGTLEGCRLVGDDIHTRESYTHSSGGCAPAGQVIIRCEGDRMRYSWIGWERVDTLLHRPGSKPTLSPSGEGTPDPLPSPSSEATPTPTDTPRPGGTPDTPPEAPRPVPPSAADAVDSAGGCSSACSTAPWPLRASAPALLGLFVVFALRRRNANAGR